jgi:hypothetical protein
MFSDLFSFYRSTEWEKLRATIISERVARDGEIICDYCHQPIIKSYDAICHHKTELTESNVFDAQISLNPDNIMVVHHKCHNAIHERWGYSQNSARHIYIVCGSPCAGKSEYVQRNAGRNDLIIDIDRLYEAMGRSRSAVKSNVLAVYRDLIDMVRTRNGRWRNVWIVRTLPMSIDRDTIVRDCNGGELIHIDTDKETCMAEAHRRGGDWVEWTESFWERFQE